MFKKILFILTVLLLSLTVSHAHAEWEVQKSGTAKTLRGVSFADNLNGWAVGDGGTVLHTADGGGTWTSQKSGVTGNLLSVCFVNSTAGWASGAAGTVLSTTDGGATWKALTSDVDFDLKSIRFADTQKGWTAGVFVLRTLDRGESWIPNMSLGNPFNALYFPDSINGRAVREGGLIMKSGDGGANWAEQTSGTANNLTAVHFVNADNGYAVGAAGTILSTGNGGAAWSLKSSGVSDDLNGVWFVSAAKGWVAGDAGTILYTDDSGNTWTDESVGTKAFYGLCFADDATNGWSVGEAGTILHTGKDTILPTVTFSPANNAKNIETNTTIKLTFSEPVRKTNEVEIQNEDLPTLFMLKKTDVSGEDAAFTGTITDATVVTLTPSAELDYSQVYYIGVGAMVEDLAGNDIAPASAKFTAKAAPAVLSVTPASLDLLSAASTATLAIENTGGGTLSWTLSESLSWLTPSKTSGTGNAEITLTYEANETGASRTGTITVTGTGATGSPKTISVTQAAAGQEPVLSVTPTSLDFAAAASTATLTIANTGSGTLIWSASESPDWISLSQTSGTGAGSITVTAQANTGSARTGEIIITGSGASGSPKSISVTQAAASTGTPILSVTPASQDVSAGSGMVTFDIANTGSGTLSWSVTKDAAWLTVIGSTSGTGNASLMVSHQANDLSSGGTARTGSITVTASGATGSPKTVTVKQASGITEQAILSIDPESQEVAAASGTNAFVMKNTGTGSMTWTAVSNASWLTVTLGAAGTVGAGESSAIVLAFGANTGDVRTGTVTVTATGAGGSPKTISVKQAAGSIIQPVLSVSPNFQTVPASGGATTFTVANTGTGTLNWSVSESLDWLSVYPLSGANNETVTVTCQQNTGASRTGSLTFAATGATGSPKTVEVRQSGTSNQAPTDILLSGGSVDENQPSGTNVGVFSTVDPDPADNHSYTLVSGDGSTGNGFFNIESGTLKTLSKFDYESKGSYSIRVKTDDGNGGTFEKSFTVVVKNVNDAPTDITLSKSTVSEGQPAGATVGEFSASDQDVGDTHVYALISGDGGTDNTAFGIEGSQLKSKVVFSLATKASYSIRVRVSDSQGLIYEKQFSITVTAAPSVTFSPANGAENIGADVNITVTFSKAVRLSDNTEITDDVLNTLLIFKKNNAEGSDVPFDAYINSTKTVITLVPSDALSGSQQYYAGVRGAVVEDASDNAVDPAGTTFTTADTEPPVVKISPADGEEDIAPDTSVIITFNEPVRLKNNGGAITDSNVADLLILRTNSIGGADVPFTARINSLKTVITLVPKSDLQSSQQYYAAIKADAEDDSGNMISGANSSFKIIAAFTDIAADLIGLARTAAAGYGDYDNDGDLDLLLAGYDYDEGVGVFRIYRNEAGRFYVHTALTGVYFCSAVWGDYDSDGDPDILLTGYDGSKSITRIYRNDKGSFSSISPGLPDVYSGAAVWGDYDRDGDLDILLTGYDNENGESVSEVYRNDGGIFTSVNAGLPPLSYSSAAWGDYDKDGDPDILIIGHDGMNRISKVYRNDGAGKFTDIAVNLAEVSSGSARWGDYDNDGDPDILITGYDIAKIYRNDGGGNFTALTAELRGVRYSSGEWGDYDNDGDLDILLTGDDGGTGTAEVYRNDSGSFTDIQAELTGVSHGAAVWGDYDGDGDLDILLTGDDGLNRISKIYRNNLNSGASAADNRLKEVVLGLKTLVGVSTSGISTEVNGNGRTDMIEIIFLLESLAEKREK